MPSISVIVPVRNEAAFIERTLRLLLTQDFPRDQFEVIVADGASTDETVAIVRRLQDEFPNLKLVYNPARFSSAGAILPFAMPARTWWWWSMATATSLIATT